MREQIIAKYVEAEHVYEVIGHNYWIFIQSAAKYVGLVIILWLVYVFAISPMQQPFLQTIWTVLWLALYGMCMYELFDEYLDVLLITDRWLVLFRREWLWNQRTDSFQWVSIESVSTVQDSFRDSLLWKWDLKIKLEDTITTFKDVAEPAHVMQMILEYKDNILWRQNYMENETRQEWDKYNLLIEALWEVVSDYVEKKHERQY